MDRSRITVIIPALNEVDSLPHVLADVPTEHRVIVVDNGSTDGTGALARSLGVEVIDEPQRGYGTAVLSGIAAARQNPPEVLVVLDADFADDPRLIDHLTQPIFEDRADFVLSDRTRTAEPGALTFTQRFGNRLSTHMIATTLGFRYRDMGPFRAIRWTSLEALNMRDPTWGWNVEMQMKAVHHQLRILEVPVPYRRRVAGRSKISGTLLGSVRAGVRIIQAVGRYRHP